MASSSCTLKLGGAGPARELLLVRENRGGSSICHRVGGYATWRGRRRRGAEATLTATPPVVESAATRLRSSACPVLPLPKEQPALAAAAVVYDDKMVEKERSRREPVTHQKLDQWLKESIEEIVRNIGEAPFLMHIFSDGGRGSGGAPAVRLEREAALPESWPRVTKRWDEESRTPDAVILVEELEEEEGESGAGAEEATTATGVVRGGTRTWGLVVQGRAMDCPSCYILNTTRVKSSMGFCTHFCLVRAKCFGEAVDVQLRNAWLVARRRIDRL